MSAAERRASACTGKEAFASRQLADRVASRMRRGGRARRVGCYRCHCCGLWHIGTDRRPT